MPLPDRSLSNAHTYSNTDDLKVLVHFVNSECLLWIRNFHQSLGGLIFTHLNTIPDTSLSLLLFSPFQTHSLPLSENPNPPLSGSEWAASAEREAVFSMICNRITAVMLSGSLWQQQGGIFTVPCEIELDFKSCRSLFTSRCRNLVNRC